MHFRALTAADVPQIYALDQRCFPPGIAYSAEEIVAYLHLPGFHQGCTESEADARLLAILLSAPNRNRGHIITIDVEESARRHGIGQQLMHHAEQHYRTHGARGMRLEAAVNNAPALAFYIRLGYRVVRTLPAYYAPDLDALRLTLDF